LILSDFEHTHNLEILAKFGGDRNTKSPTKFSTARIV
jgi:hypothetical protein